MTALDQLKILNEKINKCRREQGKPYTITVQDEIDIHMAIENEMRKKYPGIRCTSCGVDRIISTDGYCMCCGAKQKSYLPKNK